MRNVYPPVSSDRSISLHTAAGLTCRIVYMLGKNMTLAFAWSAKDWHVEGDSECGDNKSQFNEQGNSRHLEMAQLMISIWSSWASGAWTHNRSASPTSWPGGLSGAPRTLALLSRQGSSWPLSAFISSKQGTTAKVQETDQYQDHHQKKTQHADPILEPVLWNPRTSHSLLRRPVRAIDIDIFNYKWMK